MRGGHPWVFDASITDASQPGAAGDVAVLFDRKNRFLAAGLLDPDGPIRVRVLVSGTPDRIGEALFAKRFSTALQRRRPLLEDPGTTGLRLVSGENDGLPGLVADRYGDALVLKLYTSAWVPHVRAVLAALDGTAGEGLDPPDTILLLAARRVRDAAGPSDALRGPALLRGTLPPDGALAFTEHGLHLEAHPIEGQKTGFYLDQRENRARVEALVREGRAGAGPRVLNLFSYTGGFSVAAARGGAGEVTSVDQSRPALVQAERHFMLNAHDPAVAAARHRTIDGDGVTVLAQLAEARARFDLIVIDPPSFASTSAHVRRALDAYARLTTSALKLLRSGGVLVQASCSSRVSSDDFFRTVLTAASEAGRPLDEITRTGHPLDHPIGFPEGEYLKCVFAVA